MLYLSDLSRLKGFRFPRSVIGYAVWAYHRLALSLRDVENLLASRGIAVSYETVRDWVARFGAQFAVKVRRDRPRPAGKWHLDEVVVPIKGRKHWLWRAVDVNGDFWTFWFNPAGTKLPQSAFSGNYSRFGADQGSLSPTSCAPTGRQ